MNALKHNAKGPEKYIGMDVHRDSTTAVVLDAQGKVEMEVTLKTEANVLLAFLRGLRGTLHLTLEEGTYSAWLYDLLSPQVARLTVCNPRKHATRRGNKSDRIDARKLAELLRAGQLSPVYHEPLVRRTLKELAASYLTMVKDGTRVMNRLKAIYRGRGIRCTGKQVYSPRHRQRWLEQLQEMGVRQRAELLYLQLDALLKLRAPARRALLTEARRHPARRILASIPGLGPVRVALLLALVQTPYRFATKRHLWSYGGLGLITQASGQYRLVRGTLVSARRAVLVRGLNPDHHPQLKAIFKGAALAVIEKPGPLREFYLRCLDQGTKPPLARLTVARKVATLVWTLWKKGEVYDAERLSQSQAA